MVANVGRFKWKALVVAFPLFTVVVCGTGLLWNKALLCFHGTLLFLNMDDFL